MVFDTNSQNRNIPKAEDTYNYLRSMVDVMLRKSGVAIDEVFVGGRKMRQINIQIRYEITILVYNNDQ